MLHTTALPFTITCDAADTTPNGGVVPPPGMLARLKVLHDLPGSRRRTQGWCDGQMILAITLVNIIGTGRVADVDRLAADSALVRLVHRSGTVLPGLAKRTLAQRFRWGRSGPFPTHDL